MTSDQRRFLVNAGLLVAGETLRPAPRRRRRSLTPTGKVTIALGALLLALAFTVLAETAATNTEATGIAIEEAHNK